MPCKLNELGIRLIEQIYRLGYDVIVGRRRRYT